MYWKTVYLGLPVKVAIVAGTADIAGTPVGTAGIAKRLLAFDE